MKKYLSIVGVALLAALVVGAASASAALPEFKTEKFPVSFAGKNNTTLVPLTLKSSLNTVECTASQSKGNVAGPAEVKEVVVKYTGCKEGTKVCTTSGKAAGEVETKSLVGVPGYLNKLAVEAGLEMKPASGTVFAEFTCEGGFLNKVEGCAVGQVLPVNKLQTTGELLFEENSGKTAQKWTKIEVNGVSKECVLKAFNAVPSWLMGVENLTFGGGLVAVELKA